MMEKAEFSETSAHFYNTDVTHYRMGHINGAIGY
jgi:hypothetical protein